MELTPIAKKFVLHWGEMGTTWGISRTVAQVHALLFVVGKPMNAEQITETLGVARSNVSTSLRELQNWKLVKVEHELGDRRDYFATFTDVWELFRVVLRERKAREFNPTLEMLSECVHSNDFALEDKATRKRLKETFDLMSTASDWADKTLTLEPATLLKILKVGKTLSRKK
jgi:DNA-binding transcriptional regulator GbsR (MarR family)